MTNLSRGVRASDSPRWCAVCQDVGDHHTDRHEAPIPAATNHANGEARRVSQGVNPSANLLGTPQPGGPSPSSHGKPVLFDFFSGAGGCAKGYQRAGFYVVGIDINPQPNYCGDEFVQMDALEALRILLDGGTIAGYRLEDIAAFHASPPCQGYSIANNIHGRDDHPLLISEVRKLLRATGLPYVIENVEGAREDMEAPYTVCGRSLGLGVKRHRLFETNFPLMVPPCPHGHPGDWVSVFGHTVLSRGKVIGKAKGGGNTIKRQHLGTDRGREAMGIHWMTRDELSEAVPPAYTEHIAHYLLAEINAREEGIAA